MDFVQAYVVGSKSIKTVPNTLFNLSCVTWFLFVRPSSLVGPNGEVGIVVFSDNKIGIKIGDGTKTFSNLDYVKFGVLNSESLFEDISVS